MSDAEQPPIDNRMQDTGRQADPDAPVSQDEAVERTGRTEQVAGEDADTASDADKPGALGPQGDPAEGKR